MHAEKVIILHFVLCFDVLRHLIFRASDMQTRMPVALWHMPLQVYSWWGFGFLGFCSWLPQMAPVVDEHHAQLLSFTLPLM